MEKPYTASKKQVQELTVVQIIGKFRFRHEMELEKLYRVSKNKTRS